MKIFMSTDPICQRENYGCKDACSESSDLGRDLFGAKQRERPWGLFVYRVSWFMLVQT